MYNLTLSRLPNNIKCESKNNVNKQPYIAYIQQNVEYIQHIKYNINKGGKLWAEKIKFLIQK